MSYLVFAIIYYLLGGIAIGLGLHRMLAHRAVRLPRWLAYVAVTLSLPAGTPVQWVGNHRYHHAHTDRPGDPHSPHLDGFWFAHVGWYLGTHRTPACIAYALGGPLRMVFDSVWRPRTNQQFGHLAADVARDPYYAWLSRPLPYFVMLWLHLAGATGIAYLLAGWLGVALWSLQLAFMYNACDAIDSVAHLFGERLSAAKPGQTDGVRDQSRNNRLLAFITLGEGWHANHHADPASARHGLGANQFDWTWLTIKVLARLGWATEIRLPESTAASSAAS